jgi:hypothetical protein
MRKLSETNVASAPARLVQESFELRLHFQVEGSALQIHQGPLTIANI